MPSWPETLTSKERKALKKPEFEEADPFQWLGGRRVIPFRKGQERDRYSIQQDGLETFCKIEYYICRRGEFAILIKRKN
jgi:hypothetical protein